MTPLPCMSLALFAYIMDCMYRWRFLLARSTMRICDISTSNPIAILVCLILQRLCMFWSIIRCFIFCLLFFWAGNCGPMRKFIYVPIIVVIVLISLFFEGGFKFWPVILHVNYGSIVDFLDFGNGENHQNLACTIATNPWRICMAIINNWGSQLGKPCPQPSSQLFMILNFLKLSYWCAQPL